MTEELTGVDVYLKERIAELEFALEDREWINLSHGMDSTEFSRGGLQTITRLARLYYIKNSLINRGVSVKADYVFGRGVNIAAKDDTVNGVVQTFLDDLRNRAELTSHQARLQKEAELETDGNVFFAFVIHPLTGRIRIRSIPVAEVTDIITNPEDSKENWYYLREWTVTAINFESGQIETRNRKAYYPDWQYKPKNRRDKIGNVDVIHMPVYHVKIGGFGDWKFGVPEIYSALDWAKAYKTFLENWSSLMAAYAKFAWKITASGGRSGLTAAKDKLATTVTQATPVEANAAPTTASSFVRLQKDGVTQADVEVVRTAGATTSAEDGRRLLLMVAASLGLPETFFGDVSVGTLATAKSLDRPTELGFANRQTLWADIYRDIFSFVLYHAVKADNGALRGLATVVYNEYGEEYIQWMEDTNPHIDIDFPPIVENDMQAHISAIIDAATFKGQVPSVIHNPRMLARMVLTALGENDIDELLETLYPEGETDPLAPIDPSVDELTQAVAGVQEALRNLAENIHASSNNGNGSGVHTIV